MNKAQKLIANCEDNSAEKSKLQQKIDALRKEKKELTKQHDPQNRGTNYWKDREAAKKYHDLSHKIHMLNKQANELIDS
jgi:hypothetical protein